MLPTFDNSFYMVRKHQHMLRYFFIGQCWAWHQYPVRKYYQKRHENVLFLQRKVKTRQMHFVGTIWSIDNIAEHRWHGIVWYLLRSAPYITLEISQLKMRFSIFFFSQSSMHNKCKYDVCIDLHSGFPS